MFPILQGLTHLSSLPNQLRKSLSKLQKSMQHFRACSVRLYEAFLLISRAPLLLGGPAVTLSLQFLVLPPDPALPLSQQLSHGIICFWETHGQFVLQRTPQNSSSPHLGPLPVFPIPPKKDRNRGPQQCQLLLTYKQTISKPCWFHLLNKPWIACIFLLLSLCLILAVVYFGSNLFPHCCQNRFPKWKLLHHFNGFLRRKIKILIKAQSSLPWFLTWRQILLPELWTFSSWHLSLP